MTQLKRVPLPKFQYDDALALLVPRGHRFEPTEDPHISNKVTCRDCGMEGWLRYQGQGRTLVAACKQDIAPCIKTLN